MATYVAANISIAKYVTYGDGMRSLPLDLVVCVPVWFWFILSSKGVKPGGWGLCIPSYFDMGDHVFYPPMF